MAVVYAIPTSDSGGTGTWTFTSGTTLWNLIDEEPPSDVDYGSVNVDGISEGYDKGVALTKDAGTFTSAAVWFRARATIAGDMDVRLYANDGTTIIEQWTQALTTSFATYTMTALSAGDLTSFNAAAVPKLRFAPADSNIGATYSVSYGRVIGATASTSVSQLMQTGLGVLAAVSFFGPWFSCKSNGAKIRAYPACALG